MATAKIFFIQPPAPPPPQGQAYAGVPGNPVVVGNVNNAGLVRTRYELTDTPIGSAVVPAVLYDGAPAATSFIPDAAPGSYRIRLTTWDGAGGTAVDVRDFAIQTSRGWILPPFRAEADECNYAGQLEGWEYLLNAIFLDINSALGGAGGAGQVNLPFTFAVPNGVPQLVGVVPSPRIVHAVQMQVTTAWDQPVAFSVGDGGNPTRFMAPGMSFPQTVGLYKNEMVEEYLAPTQVFLIINHLGPPPAAGQARVVVYYS
jgi:hypothetical protein